MRRNLAWIAVVAVLLNATVLLGRKGGPTRESLMPVMRVGQQHGRQLERVAGGLLPITADEEIRVGRRLTACLPPSGPSRGRVESIGRRLEATGLVPRFAGRYRYTTRTMGSPNAHVLPGGTVVVNESLVKLFEDDASRLAFVIGHELAHAELGHTADTVRYRIWMKRLHLPGANVAQGLRQLQALAYSPSQELEADALAVRMMKKADYRAAAGIEGLERMRPHSRRRGRSDVVSEVLTDYFRTHPGDAERIAHIRREL